METTPWLTAKQYEVLSTFAPDFTGFLLLVMDANIATAKNIYGATRLDIQRNTDRIIELQQEVDDLRQLTTRLLEEIQSMKMERP